MRRKLAIVFAIITALALVVAAIALATGKRVVLVARGEVEILDLSLTAQDETRGYKVIAVVPPGTELPVMRFHCDKTVYEEVLLPDGRRGYAVGGRILKRGPIWSSVNAPVTWGCL
jgi:hypothetical protein